jgi:hypothetical protein
MRRSGLIPAGQDLPPNRDQEAGPDGRHDQEPAYDLYAKKNLAVYRYALSNCRGTRVRILAYGGIVQSIDVPGRSGREADVVLGFKTLKDYVAKDSPPVTANGGPYFGETIGRYGNRIAKGTLKLDGHTYTPPVNNGVNSLHGGLVGFGNHVWASHEVVSAGSTWLARARARPTTSWCRSTPATTPQPTPRRS